ncbi:hypothetical protein M422DRAFT_244126 [Sphaerobolus stellatus SS14]|nr:hypothetical protein M422DRAFT_244126 [Sphaerobolus stellatus SS14]
MSHKRGVTKRAWADELSMPAVEDGEPTPGLTMGDLTNPPSTSVDPQQTTEMLAPEHLDEPYVQAYGAQTVPSQVQSPLRVAGTAHWGSDSPRQVAVTLGTATQSFYSPRGMDQGSGLWQNLGDAPSEPDHVSPDAGDTDEEEHFTIPASEVGILCQEYTEFINLKDNTEIVLTSMNRMSPCMKELFIVPSKKALGKTCEPGNNRAHDKAAAKAATEQIIAQTAIIEPVPKKGTEEHERMTQLHVPGDQYSRPPIPQNICENIPHAAHSEQSDDSQPWHGRDAHTGYARATRDERVMTQSRTHHARDISVTEGTCVNSQESTHRRCNTSPINTQCEPGVSESIEHSQRSIRDPQSIDMNALREEIKEMISATIKEKLHSDADSVTTVSQSILALDANAQYWSDLSNKAARCSRRALELQLKLTEEKVNTLLHEEAPEEVLLEAAVMS